MLNQLRRAGFDTAWPRVVFTHHLDHDRVPLRLYEACVAGNFCSRGRRSLRSRRVAAA